MQVYAVVAQRKQNYEGEHAPELIEAFDEFTRDDNPDLFDKTIEEIQADMTGKIGSISAYAVLELTIDDALIDQALNPSAAGHIVGKILSSTLSDGEPQT